MLYMVSQSTGDGALVDQRRVQAGHQHRPGAGAGAEPRLGRPAAAAGGGAAPRRHGAQELARPDDGRAPDLAGRHAATSSTSPTTRRINIKDVLTRVDGVGDTIVFGARDYSMRVWLDPAKVQARGLTASDVVAALRAANLQVAAGAINQPPATSPGGFQLAVQTLGRLTTPGAVRRHRRRDRSGRPGDARARHRPRRARRAGLHDRTPISTTRSRPRSASSSGRARTRSRPRRP